MEQPQESIGRWPSSVTARLLESSSDLACIVGFDGRFRELDGDWQTVLGRSAAELRSRPLASLVLAEDWTATTSQLNAARADGRATRFDNRLVTADGSVRWSSWTVIASPYEQAFHAVVLDVSARYAAEAHRQESERRYLDIIDSAHDIVQSILPDGHFEFVNRAWHDSLGYTPDELADLTLFDIVAEADRDHCTMLIGQIMRGQSFDHIEVTFVAKDGRTFPVEGNATGRFRNGEFVATHTFFSDVSDRRRAEALQAAYQHQLEQEVAERSAALVQSEKLATLGRLSAGMAHELNNPASAAQRGAALLETVFAKTSSALLDLARTAPAAKEVDELTRLLEREAAPQSAVDPLERSAREGEVEDWLAGHGLGDAWETAAALAELGLAEADLDALAAQFPPDRLRAALAAVAASTTVGTLLAQVRNGAVRISQIVAALKDYSYMDRAPIQDVDVHTGIDSTLIMLQSKLKHGIEVHRDYGSDVPRIETSGSELNQVWTNLIDNAVDAMDGSGRLTIRTRREGDGVAVEVEDDGPGIPAGILDKVFDPFFTTKPLGRGTGLGLNIVFNTIHGSGGRVEVRSEPGHTVFHVSLPPRLPDPDDRPPSAEGHR